MSEPVVKTIRQISYLGTVYSGFTVNEALGAGIPQDVINNAILEEELGLVRKLRKSAYEDESDPLFLEWQYDKTLEKENAWRDKVAEIKQKYPLPEDAA